MITKLIFLLFSFSALAISPKAKAPNFKLKAHDNQVHSLSEFKGKPVVLEWLNHGCPFVKKHYNSGNMQATQKQAKEKGFVWLSIISSAPGKQGHVNAKEANRDRKNKNSMADYILLDANGAVGRKFDAKATPHIVVLDKNHKVQYMGAIDSIPSTDVDDVPKAENYVLAAINGISNGNYKARKTQAYGCSVKY